MYQVWSDLNKMISTAWSGMPPEMQDQPVAQPIQDQTHGSATGASSGPQSTTPSSDRVSADGITPSSAHQRSGTAPLSYSNPSPPRYVPVATALGGAEPYTSRTTPEEDAGPLNSDELDLDLTASAPPLSFSAATIVSQVSTPGVHRHPSTSSVNASQNMVSLNFNPAQAPGAAPGRSPRRGSSQPAADQKVLRWWATAPDSNTNTKPTPPEYDATENTNAAPPVPAPAPMPSPDTSEEPLIRPKLEHPFARKEFERRMRVEARARQERVQAAGNADPADATESSRSATGSSSGMRLSNSDLSYFAELALCDAVTCPMCARFFTDPVTLPCGHSVCAPCLYSGWDTDVERGVANRVSPAQSASTPTGASVGLRNSPTSKPSGITLRFTKCALCQTPVHNANMGQAQYLRPSISLVALSALGQRLVRARVSLGANPNDESEESKARRSSREYEFLEDMKAGLMDVYGDTKVKLNNVANQVAPFFAEATKSARETFHSAYTRLFGEQEPRPEHVPLETKTSLSSTASAPDTTLAPEDELALRVPNVDTELNTSSGSVESPQALTPRTSDTPVETSSLGADAAVDSPITPIQIAQDREDVSAAILPESAQMNQPVASDQIPDNNTTSLLDTSQSRE